jgi:small subunit ribosomal protein S1
LSIKQAAEGGEVAAEYREYYGEHAYDDQGNYIGPDYHGEDAPGGEREGQGEGEGEGTAAGSAEAGGEAPQATEEPPAEG